MDTRTYIASELEMKIVYEVDWSEKKILTLLDQEKVLIGATLALKLGYNTLVRSHQLLLLFDNNFHFFII
jgi:hypothetical protein